MSFRFWVYFVKISAVVLGPIVLCHIFFRPGGVFQIIGVIALGLFLALSIVGGFMGILLACGRLRMRCPFCGRSGLVQSSEDDKFSMRCDACGLIRCTGVLGLRIVRER